MRFVFELFHCDDALRSDESMDYRLAATFRPEDVTLHEGVLWHEEGDWLGTILDLQTQDGPLRSTKLCALKCLGSTSALSTLVKMRNSGATRAS